jgi:hypothetical protein
LLTLPVSMATALAGSASAPSTVVIAADIRLRLQHALS